MDDKSKYLIKNIGILTISNFASKILVFLLVPLYTSVLSTEEYGIYDMVVATTQLVFPLLSLNIVDAVMRFTMDKSKNGKQVAIIGLRYISLSIIPVTVFIVVEKYVGVISEIDNYLLLILFYYVFYILHQYCVQLAKGLERVADLGVSGVLSSIVLIISNVLFLLVYKIGLQGFFYSNILSLMIPTIYLGFRVSIWNYIRFHKPDKELRTQMLHYCIPLIFTTVSWWVNNASDRYVVTILIGAAANGLLSAAYKIPSILNTIQQIFVQAWQISAIKEYKGNKTKEFYGETFVNINLLMCIFCCFLLVFLKTISFLLFKKEFASAWIYVPFLLIASVFNSASGFMGPILLAKKDSNSMAKSAVAGGICNIILNIALVLLIGIQGVTIATAISSAVIYFIRRKGVSKDICIEKEWKIYMNWVVITVYALCVIFFDNVLIHIVTVCIMLILNYSQIGILFRKLVPKKDMVLPKIKNKNS